MWGMRHAYAFIAPFYLLFLVFGAFPLGWSLVLTFQEWDGLRPMRHVGLKNFAMLLRDQRFLDAVGNTALYWIVDVVFILGLALLMAILLHTSRLSGTRVYRLVLFLPNVTATVAVGLVFTMVFDFNSGLANAILQLLGIPSHNPAILLGNRNRIPARHLFENRNLAIAIDKPHGNMQV